MNPNSVRNFVEDDIKRVVDITGFDSITRASPLAQLAGQDVSAAGFFVGTIVDRLTWVLYMRIQITTVGGTGATAVVPAFKRNAAANSEALQFFTPFPQTLNNVAAATNESGTVGHNIYAVVPQGTKIGYLGVGAAMGAGAIAALDFLVIQPRST